MNATTLFSSSLWDRPFRRWTPTLGLFLCLTFTLCSLPPHCNDANGKPPPAPNLTVTESVLSRLATFYVEPLRIRPKTMFVRATEELARTVPELQTKPDLSNNLVALQIQSTTITVPLPAQEPELPWLLPQMKKVFEFLQKNVIHSMTSKEWKNAEYAAIGGMLSTLDPHTALLDPETFQDMKTQSQGSFGGIGAVLGIRKGQLTVIRTLPNTPLWNAGVRHGDVIVRIKNEPTTNMLVPDAAKRLRGEPGSQVAVWIQKKGETTARYVNLTREDIQVSTVMSQLLSLREKEKKVAYIRIAQFNKKVADDLEQAWEKLSKGHSLAGLVLDLRGNPGGLMDQAVRVADAFLSSGTIVKTVTPRGDSKEEAAHRENLVPEHLPIAVLIDESSASASEIVAGSLQQLNRAILIGTPTFGKGSVQTLFDLPDESALKLTIAQYLTAGERSIQSVGVSPDVQLESVYITPERVHLFHSYSSRREKDLQTHLDSPLTHPNDPPPQKLHFLFRKPPSHQLSTNHPEEGEDEEEDFEGEEAPFFEDGAIQTAKELLATIGSPKRETMLTSPQAKAFYERQEAQRQEEIKQALNPLGIDWSPASAHHASPELVATVDLSASTKPIRAGETALLSVTVTNHGSGLATQVRADTKSELGLLDGWELLFGRIPPGESRTRQVKIKVPSMAPSRVDRLELVFYEEHGQAPAPKSLLFRIEELPKPQFAYRYQLIDSGLNSNGDGTLQQGESATLQVILKNMGVGGSPEPKVALQSTQSDLVLVNQGRFELKSLLPGAESSELRFTFDLLAGYQEPQIRFRLQVYDPTLQTGLSTSDLLRFPVESQGIEGQPSTGICKTNRPTPIWASANFKSQPLGHVPANAKLPVDKLFPTVGSVRVVLTHDQPGFLPLSVCNLDQNATAPPAEISWVWQVTPPKVRIDQPALRVSTRSTSIRAVIEDNNQLLDAMIFVSNPKANIQERKVYYQSYRSPSTDAGIEKNSVSMQVAANVPLWPGLNVITVVARESEEVNTSSILFINRDDTSHDN